MSLKTAGKRSAHIPTLELLANKCFSEKERATFNSTYDHCYGKKTLSPNRLHDGQDFLALLP